MLSFLIPLLITAGAPGERVQLAQLTIEQRVIIRVPLTGARPRTPLPKQAPDMREKKGPRCLEMRDIRRAAVISQDSILLITDDDDRYRARMERGCRATDFYSGFYMEPERDGDLCAGRDMLRARNGTECMVAGFTRVLEEKPKKKK